MISVEGAELLGTTLKGIPMVQGSNNLIKIKIDNPIDINLKTFQNNTYPYLNGDDNVVEVDISGGDNFVQDVTLNDNSLTILKKTVNGTQEKTVKLPYTTIGTLKELICDYNTKKIYTSWSKDIDDPRSETFWSVVYNIITDDLGNIISIER